jgi:hypothetical protein
MLSLSKSREGKKLRACSSQVRDSGNLFRFDKKNNQMRKNAQIFWYQKKGSLWVTYQSWLKLLIVNKQHINQSMDLGEKHLDHLAGDRIKGQTVTKDMELNVCH